LVYFVQGVLSKKIKIGATADCPKSYIRRTIQSRSGEEVSLLGVIPSAKDDVKIQLLFKVDWSHGEWFNPSQNILEYILKHTQDHACILCPKTFYPTPQWSRCGEHLSEDHRRKISRGLEKTYESKATR
jgi:hypothetical protein